MTIFVFLARQRGAIGCFGRFVRELDVSDDAPLEPILCKVPDLEVNAVLFRASLASPQDHPKAQGEVVAYEILNDVANGPFSLGFVHVRSLPSVQAKVNEVYRPLLSSWTVNQLEEYSKHNGPPKWIRGEF